MLIPFMNLKMNYTFKSLFLLHEKYIPKLQIHYTTVKPLGTHGRQGLIMITAQYPTEQQQQVSPLVRMVSLVLSWMTQSLAVVQYGSPTTTSSTSESFSDPSTMTNCSRRKSFINTGPSGDWARRCRILPTSTASLKRKCFFTNITVRNLK